MSKVDAQRAMREARWAERQKGAVAPRPAPARSAAPADVARPVRTATAKAPVADVAPTDGPAAADELCGHRSMNNKSCRRPAGHSEKNHRYT